MSLRERTGLTAMVRVRLLLRQALVSVLLVASDVGTADEHRVFILAPEKGAELLHQCSRAAPQNVDGFWAPASQDVAELEALLQRFLASDAAGTTVLPLDRYHRQYVGFTKGGKRFIYGNFYRAPAGFVSKHEATEPVLVCDGGSSFWGIVFSVESKSFADMAFNGPA